MDRVECIKSFLSDFGCNLKSSDMKDTPARVTRMYGELFKGLVEPMPRLATFDNPGYDEIVVLRNIEFVSVCEHHCLPFLGHADIGYIPKKKVVGVSKLARILDWYAARPQIQERLTQQVADLLWKELNPRGVIVVIEARHMCIAARGVKKQDSTMVTSALRGAFKKSEPRQEFFNLIKGRE